MPNDSAVGLEAFVNETSEYYLWGAGIEGERAATHLGKHIKIRAVIDSDSKKHDKLFCGYKIIPYQEIYKDISGAKILVSNGSYLQIKQLLETDGFLEYQDYCYWKEFLGDYFWRKYNKVCLYQIDLAVTQRCTLNCKACNMWMPLFKNPQDYEMEKIVRDIDAYFEYVDYVLVFNILGGEPFLFEKLAELLEYLGERYIDKIGEIQLYTNATILPGAEILRLCKKYDVNMLISDYSNVIPHIKNAVTRFADTMKSESIRFRSKSTETWLDFGFPYTNRNSSEANKTVFELCRPTFRGLYDRKLYYCHLQASAERLGQFEGALGDFFDLSGYDEKRKPELIKFDLGFMPNGYISFCSRCDGCGSNNRNMVAAAEQIERGL